MSTRPRTIVLKKTDPKQTGPGKARGLLSQVSWETPFSDELWRQVTSTGEVHKRGRGKSQSEPFAWVDIGTALPRNAGDQIAEALCIWHDGKKSGSLGWVVIKRPEPAGKRPKFVLDADKKIGGRNGLASCMNSLLGDGPLPAGSYSVRFSILQSDGLVCKLVPRDVVSPDPVLTVIGRGAKLEEVGYRFKDGILGIDEIAITYRHRKPAWDVSIEARAPVKIGNQLDLPFCADIVEFVLAQLFERKRFDVASS